MNLSEYKEVKTKKLSEKDKIFIIGIILLIVVAVFFILHSDKFKLQKTKEADVKISPSSSETRKELLYKQNNSFEENSLSFVQAKMTSLQLALIAKGQITYAAELSKVIALYDLSDQTALAGLSSVTDELLKFNINYSFPHSRKTNNYINFAVKHKLITKTDKIYLVRIKEMNYINRMPDLLNNPEQIERDLFKGLVIIENLI